MQELINIYKYTKNKIANSSGYLIINFINLIKD